MHLVIKKITTNKMDNTIRFVMEDMKAIKNKLIKKLKEKQLMK